MVTLISFQNIVVKPTFGHLSKIEENVYTIWNYLLLLLTIKLLKNIFLCFSFGVEKEVVARATTVPKAYREGETCKTRL